MRQQAIAARARHVLRHPQNVGKRTALRTGFAAANGADVIVTIDTDGQHDLSNIQREE